MPVRYTSNGCLPIRAEMDSAAAPRPREIGSKLVERDLITADQFEEALRLQVRSGALLSEILITEFGVSRPELQRLLTELGYAPSGGVLRSSPASDQQEQPGTSQAPSAPGAPIRRRIGEIFVELGFVSTAQLEAALVEQRKTGARIGEILIEQGSLTRLDLASALAEHWEPVIPQPEASGPSLSGLAARADNGVPGAELVRQPRARQRSLVPRTRVTDWIPEGEPAREAASPAVPDDAQDAIAALGRTVADLGDMRTRDALATGARLTGVETAIVALAGLETRVREALDRDLAAHLEALTARLERIEHGPEGAADHGSRLQAGSEETAVLRARVDELEDEVARLRSDAEQATEARRSETG